MRRGWPLFWTAFGGWAGYHLFRYGRQAFARPPGAVADLGRDLEVGDFEAFYRCALRMSHGQPMYFTDGSRLEIPSKQAPFFELLLQPLLPLGPAWAQILFGLGSFALLAWTLVLGRRLATPAGGPEASRWLPVLALALLAPFAHLAASYSQTVFLLVWLAVLGLLLLPRRPFAAGLVWSLAIAIKAIPVVLLVWLVWRRCWRAVAGIAVGLALTTAACLVHQGPERGIGQFAGYFAMLRADPAFGRYHERYQGLPSLVMATVTPRYEAGIASAAQQRDWNGVRNFLGGTGLDRYLGVLLGLVVLAVILPCALACRPRGPDPPHRLLLETGLVLTGMLIVSPHTWKHYFWWLFPAVLVALVEARQRRSWAVAFVVVATATLTLPHRGLLGGLATWWNVFHGPALGCTILFGLLAWRALGRAPVSPACAPGTGAAPGPAAGAPPGR